MAGAQEAEGQEKAEIRGQQGQSTWGPGAMVGTWPLSQTGSPWTVFAEKSYAQIYLLKDDSGCHMEDRFCEIPFCESQFSHLYNGFTRNLVKSMAKGFLA